MPVARGHLTPKLYVENAIFDCADESSSLEIDPQEKLKLDNQDSITLNSSLFLPKTTKETPTKVFVDSLSGSDGDRRD